MKYTRSVIAQNQSVAASSVSTWDLPVNPLSHLIITIRGTNAGAVEATIMNILDRLQKVEVLYKGSSIASLSGTDLWRLDAILFGKMPILLNQVATASAARALSLVLPFSRKMLDPNEAFPASSRGELKLQITLSATETAINNITLQIEAVEMPEAKPKQYLKATTLSLTPTSGIDNDIALPIGNKYAGLMLFSSTVPTSTSFTATISKAKLLLNGLEQYFSSANWESLHGDLLNRIGHVEAYDLSADDDDLAKVALMDFSPNNVDDFLLDTKGASSLVLKITAGDASPIRVIPLELPVA
jgi:hypothetical protein